MCVGERDVRAYLYVLYSILSVAICHRLIDDIPVNLTFCAKRKIHQVNIGLVSHMYQDK